MPKLPKKTNIVIVNDFDYVQGGASKVAIDTANLLAENTKDINIYFFSAVHYDKTNLNPKVIKVCTNQIEALRDKNKIRGFFNGIYNIKAKNKLKKLLDTLNKDETIIHIHGWTKCLSSSVFDIAFKKKYKVILTLHDYFTACPNGGYFNYPKNEICNLKPLSYKCIKCNCDSRNYVFKLYRILRQFVQNKIVMLNDKLENVITISEFSENILKNTLNKNTKITRIYNPIDFDEKAQKIDPSKNKYYLYVGRVSKEKGVDLFCEAISKLKLKGIVVGDGDQKKILEEKYQNIEFVGWKDSEEVKEYMRKARALIFPSRWYEGAPLTPLEAMQYGIPSLTSDCCAAVEYVNKEIYNETIFKLNVEEMVKTIKNYDENIKQISKMLNISVLEKSYKENYINSLKNLYRGLL